MVGQGLRHPDCGGGITQANGAAFEVFDADPGADQAIEPARHSWIRAQSKVVTDHIATDPEARAFLDHWATSETSSR